MDAKSHIESNFNLKCIRRDLQKLSTIYRQEYLIEEIMKIIDEVYNDKDEGMKITYPIQKL